MKTLVLWSGGVESTSLLLHLLRTTNDEVHAHHVVMNNTERRATREQDAVVTLRLAMMRNERPFGFDTSSVSVCEGEALPVDYELLYPIGRAAARHIGAERVLRGWCAEDEYTRAEGHPRRAWPGSGTRFGHLAMLALGPDAKRLAPWLDIYSHSKLWHWQNLGLYAGLTWSCRRPVGYMSCGKCHACIERSACEAGRNPYAD